MAKIKSPNKQFAGNRAGVSFVKGEAETDDKWAIEWFKNNGYEVEEEQTSTEKPISKLTKDELKVKLDEIKVTYDEEAGRDDLYALLKQAIEQKGEGGGA